jgi:hypothetical protein
MSKGARYSGGCLCGAVRYVCAAKPVHAFFCHCRDCQKETGGPFAAEIYVPAGSVNLEGRLSRYSRIGDSGKSVHRHFCARCGSVVLTTFESAPEHVCLKACSLDDPADLKPEFHLYVSSKQPWDVIRDELPQHPRDF